jgi:hypothetical protein
MKTLLALLAVAFSLPVVATAQPVPSAYVPLAPCLLADQGIAANTTAYLLVRGKCNVPTEANAVTFTVLASTRSGAGVAIFGSDLPWSGLPTALFKGSLSTEATVRLCYPEAECRGEDLAVRAIDAPVRVVLLVVGYHLPL